jgi:hypothetical protein
MSAHAKLFCAVTARELQRASMGTDACHFEARLPEGEI